MAEKIAMRGPHAEPGSERVDDRRRQPGLMLGYSGLRGGGGAHEDEAEAEGHDLQGREQVRSARCRAPE